MYSRGTPRIHYPESLQNLCVTKKLDDGSWVFARSAGNPGWRLTYRLKCAWLVFTGRADVLVWSA